MRVQCGTGLVIGKVLETRFGLFRWIQQAGRRVTGEILRQALHGSPRALANRTRSFRVAGTQLLQSLLEPGRIELMDGEDPHTALCAPWLAHQPFPAAAGSVGQRSVDNLDQLVIA